MYIKYFVLSTLKKTKKTRKQLRAIRGKAALQIILIFKPKMLILLCSFLLLLIRIIE
jgi:hypothetical protein